LRNRGIRESGGCAYYITFIEDYMRRTWTDRVTCGKKHEAPGCLTPRSVALVEAKKQEITLSP